MRDRDSVEIEERELVIKMLNSLTGVFGEDDQQLKRLTIVCVQLFHDVSWRSAKFCNVHDAPVSRVSKAAVDP